LFGTLDMPTPSQLPDALRPFASFQAVFAREPSFDVALSVLANTLREIHGVDFVENNGDTKHNAVASSRTGFHDSWLSIMIATTVIFWLTGRLSIYLGTVEVSDRDINALALLIGAKFYLLTAVLGLTPYLSYWLISVLRARSRLPTRNTTGILSIATLTCGITITGLFLILSCIPGWRLRPLWIFPEDPDLLDYSLLALSMLCIVLLSSLILFEPSIRKLQGKIRERLLFGLNIAALIVLLAESWLLASLILSFPFPRPPLPQPDYIAWLGYFLLLPTLSVIYAYGLAIRQATTL
jgi:hypothetical protein